MAAVSQAGAAAMMRPPNALLLPSPDVIVLGGQRVVEEVGHQARIILSFVIESACVEALGVALGPILDQLCRVRCAMQRLVTFLVCRIAQDALMKSLNRS
jgi:hypothetical protein